MGSHSFEILAPWSNKSPHRRISEDPPDRQLLREIVLVRQAGQRVRCKTSDEPCLVVCKWTSFFTVKTLKPARLSKSLKTTLLELSLAERRSHMRTHRPLFLSHNLSGIVRPTTLHLLPVIQQRLPIHMTLD